MKSKKQKRSSLKRTVPIPTRSIFLFALGEEWRPDSNRIWAHTWKRISEPLGKSYLPHPLIAGSRAMYRTHLNLRDGTYHRP